MNAGRADFTPVFLSDVPRPFETTPPLDFAFIQVSPRDRFGFCSLGVSVDCAKPAALAAKAEVAQVNSQMPRTHGDSFLDVSQIDYLVPSDRDLIEVNVGSSDDGEYREIGRLVASLEEDTSTIQTGSAPFPTQSSRH